MEGAYRIQILESVKDFITALPVKDQAKARALFEILAQGEFDIVYIKTLRSPIKELIIKQYRFIFCIHRQTIFFIGAFIKKTNKTPKQEIENAYSIYKMIIEL